MDFIDFMTGFFVCILAILICFLIFSLGEGMKEFSINHCLEFKYPSQCLSDQGISKNQDKINDR